MASKKALALKAVTGFMTVLMVLWPGGRGLLAWDAIQVQPMSFGRVIPAATAATVEIDGRSGFSTASQISGGTVNFLNTGYTGYIRIITNSTMGGEAVTVSYPNTTPLFKYSGGSIVDSLKLYYMNERSQTSGTTVLGSLDLYMGGRLDIKGGQSGGVYNGAVNVVIIIN